MSLLHPAWVEIDLGAITANVRAVRGIIGPGTKLYAVLKDDAYGCGIGPAAITALAGGADAVVVSTPDDARIVRGLSATAPILVLGSTLPEEASALAELDVIVTIHNFEGLEAFGQLSRPVRAFIKVDTGIHRLGFGPGEWGRAFARARELANIHVQGIWTHFPNPDDRSLTTQNGSGFEQACADADAAGFDGLEYMAASSRVVLGYPQLRLTAVDPGRILVGMLEGAWKDQIPWRPALAAVKSRLIQIKHLAPGVTLGYSGDDNGSGARRIGYAPIGFAHGIPQLPSGGTALVGGRRAALVGARHTEYTAIDITHLPDVGLGSEVVFLGSQGEERITHEEYARMYQVPVIQAIPRLGRLLPRVYLGQDQ